MLVELYTVMFMKYCDDAPAPVPAARF